MIKNNPTNVEAAFEILLEEIEADIDFVNNAGAKGFEARDYEKAKDALEQAAALTVFREKVSGLTREWKALQPPQEGGRRNLGRLGRSLRTPEEVYFQPILATLSKNGGKAKMADVITAVGKKMKGTLQKVDYEPLASDPELPRWRNTAQWARYSLVRDGLMKSGSPRGVWEVSEAGKQWLAGIADKDLVKA